MLDTGGRYPPGSVQHMARPTAPDRGTVAQFASLNVGRAAGHGAGPGIFGHGRPPGFRRALVTITQFSAARRICLRQIPAVL
jgi:hypothetical protein